MQDSSEISCWESLIARRMRPCATMPKEVDPSKRAKKISDARFGKTQKKRDSYKAWAQTPAGKESIKNSHRKYDTSPKGKANAQRKRDKYYATHKDDPEFKARKNARNRDYRARKKAKKSGILENTPAIQKE